MPSGSFTVDAWILGTRWQHHRTRDHFGAESDLYVTLSQNIGPWLVGEPIHEVLQDIVDRLVALEGSLRVHGSFTIDAYIWPHFFTIDAILEAPRANSFSIDAFFNRGTSFSVDAWLRPTASFTIDAILV